MKKSIHLSKIINDPVHGFIEVPRDLLLPIIDHPIFQRLRRIKQLGMSSIVYPGATHTRFNHALGAMHLTRLALDSLRRKNVPISEEEYNATLTAILLHDIGHGPFSHALEQAIIPMLHHERMSLALMKSLNKEFDGQLDLAIEIFSGNYSKKFLHQLVSSQLDMDRMDYLIRDSFFTGVVEGIVGIDRIIKILNAYDGQLVCESKGIYSVEKFVVARRLMYWQVYLHKAALSAELMLLRVLERVRHLTQLGIEVPMDDDLLFFFTQKIDPNHLTDEVIQRYVNLDDSNIEFAIKIWQHHSDRVLSELCKSLVERRLLKLKLKNKKVKDHKVKALKESFMLQHNYSQEEAAYFIFTGKVSNQAYLSKSDEPILIWAKYKGLKDLATASDLKNIGSLSKPVVKNYVCHPPLSY